MNWYPLRRLLPLRGPAFTELDHLRSEKFFPGAYVYGVARSRNVKRLIIGIGQAHPVLSGRISFFAQREIAACQYWILQCCKRLHENQGVRAFGQEGLSYDKRNPTLMRLQEDILASIRRQLEQAGSDESFLREAGKRWTKALRGSDTSNIASQALSLHALTLLQALYPTVGLFALEEMSVHHAITTQINVLEIEIARAEAMPAFKKAMGKEGRGLNKEEYSAMKNRNALAQRWNALLASPQRDNALWQNVELHAKGAPDGIAAVFVLGEGHREHFLQLVQHVLPPDALFVWVTPAPLLFWQRVKWTGLVTFGLGLLILAGLIFKHVI
ncbi:MAG: hypothetical protein KBD00_00625 [Candidatus Peribacteraceae bacterium]|nr:hypothetical protein [Candidatus Peribacteraceae bacterium]